MSKCTNVNIEKIQKMDKKSFVKSVIGYLIVFLAVLAFVIFLNLNQSPKNKKVQHPPQFVAGIFIDQQF